MTRNRIEFDLETKLVTVLEREARSSGSPFAKRGAELLVVRESTMGSTIPDLVIVRRLRHRTPGKPVRLTSFESWVIGELLRTGDLGELMLTRRLFTRIESTRSALKKLERLGMVRQTETGAYAVTTDFSARFEVVSIEAKLTRWARAIEQAKRYLPFSDESFIALPSLLVANNEMIGCRCAEAGVGLIAVSRTDVTVVQMPLRLITSARRDLRQWTWLLAKTGALQF